MRHTKLTIATAICALLAACGSPAPSNQPPSDSVPATPAPPRTATPAPPVPGAFPAGDTPADQAFRSVAREAIADLLRRHPSVATDLGIHTYDRNFEDLSQAAVADESKALAEFRSRIAAIDANTLSPDAQLDREQMLHAFDAALLGNDVIRQWAKNPDYYSTAVTNGAYVIMKRDYKPAADRLGALIDREAKMPAALAEARKNLKNPPRIYTQIALDQIDENIR